MKSLIRPVIGIWIFFQLPIQLSGQDPCQGLSTEYFLNSNNIRASFLPRGTKFTDGSHGKFIVPYRPGQTLSTVFASVPWIAGFDDAGNLKIAAETHFDPETYIFNPGPLSSIGVANDTFCKKYDRAWSVYIDDIRLHQWDYAADQEINRPLPSIFGWPARGNKFFFNIHGFELPDDNQGLASFADLNGNDRYDPDKGEHPVVRRGWQQLLPDQIVWMVFNDGGRPNEPREPIRVEIQLTAYAFRCQNNSFLNNTIFTSYKIINRAIQALDSVYFGMWTDYNLGCPGDDFIGSDSTRHSEFVYNSDASDGTDVKECNVEMENYPGIAPVQSMTWLTHPMHSMIELEPEVTTRLQQYQALNGRWPDNTRIYPEGDGHSVGSELTPTKFLFHGDPRDTASWSARNVQQENTECNTVSSISIGRMDPGFVRTVELAYMFHHHPDSGHLGQISVMYNAIDSLLNSLSTIQENCIPFDVCVDGDCVWPGDFDKNGIADHQDYMMWAVMYGQSGLTRPGQPAWRSHYANDWNSEVTGINVKNGDADGNGVINTLDLQVLADNFLLTAPGYVPLQNYQEGNEVTISANNMTTSGGINNLQVHTTTPLQDVIGFAFEIEYDTFHFSYDPVYIPAKDSNQIIYVSQVNEPFVRFAIIQADRKGIHVEAGSLLGQWSSTIFQLKPWFIPHEVECTQIRLRNISVMYANGSSMDLGSTPLTVCRDEFVGIHEPEQPDILVHPNPAHDLIYVASEESVNLEILDTQGRLVMTRIADGSNPVNISNLSQGLYLVRFLHTGQITRLVVY